MAAVCVDGEELENRSGQHEDVPDAVTIQFIFLTVEQNAHGVAHAPQNQEPKAHGGKRLVNGRQGNEAHPAHHDIQDHRDLLPPLHVHSGENDAHNGAGCVDAKEGPTQGSPDVHQADGNVSPQDQQEDGAVIQNLKDPLALALCQGMVEAGAQVEQDHGGPKEGHRHHVDGSAVSGGLHHQEDQTGNGQQGSQAVGDGVHQFLPQLLAADGAVGLGHGCCHGSPLLTGSSNRIILLRILEYHLLIKMSILYYSAYRRILFLI